LNAASPSSSASISPARVTLRKSMDVLRMPVAVTMKGVPGGQQSVMVTLTVRSLQDKKSISKPVYFLMPKKD
jgi:hypothetical protein